MSEIAAATSFLEAVQNVKLSELSRRDVLGEDFSFEEIVPIIEQTSRFLRKIPAERVSELPENQSNLIENCSRNAADLIGKILAFKPAQEGNPAAARSQIIAEAKSLYQYTSRTFIN